MTFSLDKMKDPKRLSPEEIGLILSHKKLIQDFLNAVEARAIDAELAGEDIPGWKVVEGRSLRKWGDEDQVADVLRQNGYEDDQIFSMKLISPAQAEKLIGKKSFGDYESLVVKPQGKPTIVPDSDKRDAVQNVSNDEAFD